MSRQSLAFYLTIISTIVAPLMCEAKPGDHAANNSQPSGRDGVATIDGNKSPTPDGSKSLAVPGIGSSSILVAKAPNIDVTKPYGYHLEPILQKINASADQRTKIVSVVQSYKSKIQPLRDEYKGKRQEFIAVMTGGGAAETIMAKQMELSHLASEITSKYTLMRLEIRRMLTPQQILQFEDYARQHGWNSH
jgi:Spy/CpxP family protein refolding chaperone